MNYAVKEIYFTLQGEGMKVGSPAVFCRFSGCNLWTGLERDRERAVCKFCDTDFVGTNGIGGGKYISAEALSNAVDNTWPHECSAPRLVVCTGGEPLLQLDQDLVQAFHGLGYLVAVETNGTLLPPAGIDWICVSPKAGTELKCLHGNELKLVFPQPDLDPEVYEGFDFDNFLLQPMAGVGGEQNMAAAAEYCHSHLGWRLSLQVHKFANIR